MQIAENHNDVSDNQEGSKITILLADDHEMIRAGLKLLLEANGHFNVVGEASDGLETLRLTEKLAPDVLILDLSMTSLHGLEVARELAHRAPRTHIVVLSMYTNDDYVRRALKYKVAAYVPKECKFPTLVEAILAAASGKHYLPPSLSETVIRAYVNGTAESVQDPFDSLTTREREVLQLVAEGLTNTEVGRRLYISSRTVESHRAHLMHKLNLKNETELIRFAFKKGLLPVYNLPSDEERN